jgi:plasmid stabilization system protein ParE
VIVLSAGARADLDRLHAFLAGQNPDAARRAVDALSDAISSLQEQPQRGRPAGIAGMRELIVPFGRSAYVVRYAAASRREAIVILRIWHGREERT